MRQPQYDAHWIEQFAQISDGVGDCDRAANVDDIMFPFLSSRDGEVASLCFDPMRGKDTQQSAMFSYVSAERRVPVDHPLRSIRAMVDVALKGLSRSFGQMYPDW